MLFYGIIIYVLNTLGNKWFSLGLTSENSQHSTATSGSPFCFIHSKYNLSKRVSDEYKESYFHWIPGQARNGDGGVYQL